jgi:threonine dehydrogenase-like Zn-dependent dehydrogenase
VRAIWIDESGVRLREDAPPPARRGEARVRVRAAGVCATDLALARGYISYRGVPGHEFVGVALDGPLANQRVVGEINAACGECDACRAGGDRHCAARTVLGILGRSGAFAEELALPARNLRAVPATLSDDQAVFVEPLAAAFAITEQVELAPGMRALVAGDGKLGLLCAQVLVSRGCEVTLAGRHAERADWLPSSIRRIRASLGARPRVAGSPFDLVVEATGDPNALATSLALVRPRGTIVLKTTSERPATIDLAPLVVDEVRLVGSRCGRFEPALEALEKKRVQVEPMIAARYPLSDGMRALEHAGRPGALKVLIEMS